MKWSSQSLNVNIVSRNLIYSQTKFDQHIKTIYVEDNSCEICGKYCAHMKDLMKHLLIRNPNFECKQCSKKYLRKQSLDYHNKSVHNKIQHACEFCSKTYKQRGHLKQHIIAKHNTSDVSFIRCNICKRAFRQKRCLIVHMYKVHMNILKFSCKLCNTSLKHEKQVSHHMQSVHNIFDDDGDNVLLDEPSVNDVVEQPTEQEETGTLILPTEQEETGILILNLPAEVPAADTLVLF
jgi:hypothetical protein